MRNGASVVKWYFQDRRTLDRSGNRVAAPATGWRSDALYRTPATPRAAGTKKPRMVNPGRRGGGVAEAESLPQALLDADPV
jgi:hypothetical protein